MRWSGLFYFLLLLGCGSNEEGVFPESEGNTERDGEAVLETPPDEETIRQWKAAEAEWEEVLDRTDEAIVKKWAGKFWVEANALASEGETSEKDPAAGLLAYQRALKTLERGVRIAGERAQPQLKVEVVLEGMGSSAIPGLPLQVNGEERTSGKINFLSDEHQDITVTVDYLDHAGQRYQPEKLEMAVDWEGLKELELRLNENRGPWPGEDYSLDIGDRVIMDFVWIETLGAWVGKYEVTNDDFRKFRPEHDSGFFERRGTKYSLNEERQPVVEVSYEDAEDFLDWLNLREPLPDSKIQARLLSEEEWTAIARCGTDRKFPWGENLPPTRGNYKDLTSHEVLNLSNRPEPSSKEMGGYRDGFAVAAPVELSGRNEWGLYGVGGNVWEWTSDGYSQRRVSRGASWLYADKHLAIDYTSTQKKSKKDRSIGFRVLLAPR